jgi:hypothetical protein
MHPVVTRGSEELSLVRPQVPLLSILTLIKFPASIYVGMQPEDKNMDKQEKYNLQLTL